MPGRAVRDATTVLVTGVSRFLGSSVAGILAGDGTGTPVVGIDATTPDRAARRRLGDAEFVRVDIRDAAVAALLADRRVAVVVHASTSVAPVAAAARAMTKETNVLGTMHLLAACQRSADVRRVVVRSTGAVYGRSATDATVVTEDMRPSGPLTMAAARDAADVEDYVRAFARRRPDVDVVIARFAEIIGPKVRTPLTRYFSLRPFVPVAAGSDRRVQFVHEDDAVAFLVHLARDRTAGAVNVAGDGTMTVDQAIHRAGRRPLPLPMAAMDAAGAALRLTGIGGFSAQQVRLLVNSRMLDTTRLRRDVGFVCAHTTREAFDDFARTVRAAP